MLRADNVICGTSTTGTGTLTLAAAPAPPGGLDFYNWLTATGQGFVSGNAVMVSYTIIEYTTSAFTTAKQTEKGIGTLTLGASLTASTLARTTVQSTVINMNSTPTLSAAAPTAITIGTAANTLLFVGASVTDLMGALSPYYDSTAAVGGYNALMLNPGSPGAAVTTNSNVPAPSGSDYYFSFIWPRTVAVRSIVAYVQAIYTGGTSNLYARIYQPNSSGRPGKLLIDFGVLGTVNASLSAAAKIQSANLSTAFLLTPGAYFIDWLGIYSGGSGTPNIYGSLNYIHGGLPGADAGQVSNQQNPVGTTVATLGSAPGPDPANVTGYGSTGAINNPPLFSLLP